MYKKMIRRSMITAFMVGVCMCSGAAAYQVLPRVSDVDRKLSGFSENRLWNWAGQWFVDDGLKYKYSPVHEAITLAALGCSIAAGDEIKCVTEKNVLQHQMVLYGVRWPDDPPFQLDRSNPPRLPNCDVRVTLRSTSQPTCWLALFESAKKAAAAHKGTGTPFGVGTMILYRSHFGDLQFMHSMASANGESASATHDKMRMWARFLWEMAGRRLPSDIYLRDLPSPGVANWFPGEMTAQNLFSTGIVQPRAHLDEVALGTLLHMVQDSFSAAHAERAEETGARCPGYPKAMAPGKLLSFRSYLHQTTSKHDAQDTASSMGLHTSQSAPSAVDASRVFVEAWKARESWAKIEPYFDCVFTLNDPGAQAGPGPYGKNS
jgi:hypothetical protein